MNAIGPLDDDLGAGTFAVASYASQPARSSSPATWTFPQGSPRLVV